jgi:hypothetical protein
VKIQYSGGRYNVTTENETEQNELETLLAEARKKLPNLKRLWEADIISISNLSEISELLSNRGSYISNFRQLLIDGKGIPLAIKNKSNSGRPLDDRSIQACMKLLLGAPWEFVLNKEKKWRRETLGGPRDPNVKGSVKRAQYKATREADMCLKRARELIERFYDNNPEYFALFIALSVVGGETYNKQSTCFIHH